MCEFMIGRLDAHHTELISDFSDQLFVKFLFAAYAQHVQIASARLKQRFK